MPRELKPCGTVAAWRRHYNHGEPIDEACRQAANEYQRRLPSAKAFSRARQRALSELSRIYYEEYSALLAKELAKENGEVTP